MPATIVSGVATNGLETTTNGRILVTSDKRLVHYYLDASYNVLRRDSTDGGSTWSTATTVLSGPTGYHRVLCTMQDGDTLMFLIYAAEKNTGSAPPNSGIFAYYAYKQTYTAGGTYGTLSSGVGPSNNTGTDGAGNTNLYPWHIYCQVDVTNHRLYVYFLVWDTTSGFQIVVQVINISTWTNIAATITGASGGGNAITGYATNSSTPTVYAIQQVGTSMIFYIWTFNGSSFTSIGSEGGGSGTAGTGTVRYIQAQIDSIGNIECVFLGGDSNLKTFSRTGTNTFSSVTTIASSISISTTNTPPRGTLGMCRLKNSAADMYVFYIKANVQANGEVYYAKRVGGIWSADKLLDGGSTTGWADVSCIDVSGIDKLAHVVYRTGTSTFNSVYANVSLDSGVFPQLLMSD